MRQLWWVPSGVEEYQLQSAVANICPNFDDDDSGVDGEYDRAVTTGLMQSPVANICLNFGPLPALVPPL